MRKGNGRRMNMGKFSTEKDVMNQLHIDLLGLGELKWTGITRLQSEDHTVYYPGHKGGGTLKEWCFIIRKGIVKAVLKYGIVSD